MELKFYWIIFLYKSSKFRFSRPLALGVCFTVVIIFAVITMPKENRWTVRNKKLRVENDFNRVMREFVTYKYGPIAVECADFYDKLRDKYPDNGTYIGAKKFRRWVTREIKEHINDNNREVDDNNNSNNEQVNGELAADNGIRDSDREANNEIRDSDREANNEIQDTDREANNEIQDTDREANDNNGQANGELLLADNEIRDILEELENGNVPLGTYDDEGIHLDLYEEFVGDVEELDIDNIFW